MAVAHLYKVTHPMHSATTIRNAHIFRYYSLLTRTHLHTSHHHQPSHPPTGEMIKKLRNEQLTGSSSSKLGLWAANNFSLINNGVPTLLNTVNLAHKVGWLVVRGSVLCGGCVWFVLYQTMWLCCQPSSGPRRHPQKPLLFSHSFVTLFCHISQPKITGPGPQAARDHQ